MRTDWIIYITMAYWITIAISRYLLAWDMNTQIKAGLAACILFTMGMAILKFRDMRRWDKISSEIDWLDGTDR